MLRKVFIEIIIFYIAFASVSFASHHSKDNDSYECKLGSKTPYRCLANYDESPLTYPCMLLYCRSSLVCIYMINTSDA